jgi:predicted amidophosphoribosyltransferase
MTASPQPDELTCSRCARRSPPDAAFCAGCGAPLRDAPADASWGVALDYASDHQARRIRVARDAAG